MSIAVIFNPHARKNRVPVRRFFGIRRTLRPVDSLYVTQTVEEIGPALEAAVRRDQTYILIDGGDGAAHWVVNEAIERWGVDGTRERFVFVTGRGGTIDYLSHAIGTTGNPRTILRTLQQLLDAGNAPELVEAPIMKLEGTQTTGAGEAPFLRHAWATALAGYGANFYGPWYRDKRLSGSLRIVALLGEAFVTAGGQLVFSGRLANRKPAWVRRNEHDFLRAFEGRVSLDGQPFLDANRQPMTHFRILHAGSVPVNLGGILQVFHQANAQAFHAHIGDLQPGEVAPVLIQAARGRPLKNPGFYDGPAKRMTIEPAPDHTLTPSLDGELFEGVGALEVTLAGGVRFARVLG